MLDSLDHIVFYIQNKYPDDERLDKVLDFLDEVNFDLCVDSIKEKGMFL